MSTDDAIAKVLAAGWHVCNLFQRSDGLWQSNLWRPDVAYPALARDFGLAKTPCGALQACIEKMGGLGPSAGDLL